MLAQIRKSGFPAFLMRCIVNLGASRGPRCSSLRRVLRESSTCTGPPYRSYHISTYHPTPVVVQYFQVCTGFNALNFRIRKKNGGTEVGTEMDARRDPFGQTQAPG